MPSITDIPTRFMRKDRMNLFFNWLFDIPLPDHVRSELTAKWAYHTGADAKLAFTMLHTKTLSSPLVRP